MNHQLSMKVCKGRLLMLVVVLAFGGMTPMFGEATANAQEGRGRKVIASPASGAAQPAPEAARGEVKNERETVEHSGIRIVRFDVAENGRRFVFDETPLHADGTPAYGNEFVTEGYIYPYGTLNGTNGVNPDGSPEFPDKVIGRWVCRGWHIGEGARTVTGPWVITHQLFDLGKTPGSMTLTTDGYELPEINMPIKRAITGGTGKYAAARGEAVQALLGFNQSNGVSLRYEVRVKMDE